MKEVSGILFLILMAIAITGHQISSAIEKTNEALVVCVAKAEGNDE